MAEQLVGNLAQPFDASRYIDEYRANLMRVIKAKMKGKKPSLEERATEAPDSGVLDLMSRLRASLAEGAGKKGAALPRKKSVAAGRKVSKAKKAKTA
jgi:DNA end-binding protein Ku